MDKKFEYPGYFARFYDLIYTHVRGEQDSGYYLNEIRKTAGKVLEIGVGTGRFFKSALDQGADIYGIDVSKSMIEVLKSKLDRKHQHRVKHLDAVNMDLGTTYDLIIAPFRMFSHILETENQIRFLNTVNSHLSPKGRFIFDLFVPNPQIMAHGIQDQTDFEGEYTPGKKLSRTINTRPDIVNQILDITMKFIWDEDNTQIKKDWNFKMRVFFRYEIEHLIRLSKLKLAAMYGDFNKNPLNKDSLEFIMVCNKT